jgi:hypothetical protein
LEGITKDREFNSNDEIKEAIPSAGNDLTFDDVHGVVRNWTIRFAWIIKNGTEYTLE